MTMSLSGMVLSSLGWELLWSTWSVYEPNLNSLSAPVTKIGTATSQIERLWVLRGTQSRRRRGVIFLTTTQVIQLWWRVDVFRRCCTLTLFDSKGTSLVISSIRSIQGMNTSTTSLCVAYQSHVWHLVLKMAAVYGSPAYQQRASKHHINGYRASYMEHRESKLACSATACDEICTTSQRVCWCHMTHEPYCSGVRRGRWSWLLWLECPAAGFSNSDWLPDSCSEDAVSLFYSADFCNTHIWIFNKLHRYISLMYCSNLSNQ